MEKVSVMGIDLAKNVIEICGQDASGTVVLRRRLPRGKLLGFLANRLPCLIGMEACGGAYHWAREIGALGHSVRLIPAQYVKGYAQPCNAPESLKWRSRRRSSRRCRPTSTRVASSSVSAPH